MNSVVAAVALATAITVQADGLDTSFKSYEDYKFITDTRSKQYELQQNAWTDRNGLRRYGALSDYMVAVGTPYGKVGDRIEITLDSGESFIAIVGDSKGDRHYHSCGRGACVVEFIVDTPNLDTTTKQMGDISYLDEKFEGDVVSITPLPSYDELQEKYSLQCWS